MIKQPPAITIHYRTLNNVTGKEIEEYRFLSNKSDFHYGYINGNEGGESEFVVELDIWNNEPSFYGGMFMDDVSDALNCKFTAWDNEKLNTSYKIRSSIDKKPYIHARCVTRDFPEFKPIAGNVSLNSENLYGTVTESPGIISGQHGGDHFVIQTKISIPPLTKVGFKSFVFEFTYNYE